MVARVGMCAYVRAYVVVRVRACVHTVCMHLCVHVYVRMCVHECVYGRVCQSKLLLCVCACGFADIYANVRVHVCLLARA